ncbi:MAG: DNA-J related domain-containing protein [Pseudomonas sp.]|uniref:DNA-J related domain-containing protein n=1 Tax=Pseudomonas sp. TaxID=306 RepID=UPI003398B094
MNANLDPASDLAQQLLDLLRAAPDGCSEYGLIQRLRARQSPHVPQQPLTDKLVLFRTHFLLFNALYQLRDRLWQSGSGHLAISPLCIQLLPYQPESAALTQHDPLRSYYLDLSQLQDTGEREVEQLLASFWQRLRGGDEKQAALQLFELDAASPSLDLATVKYRYRQLVSQHHPDRGGSHERLQSINLAMEILERYYQ